MQGNLRPAARARLGDEGDVTGLPCRNRRHEPLLTTPLHTIHDHRESIETDNEISVVDEEDHPRATGGELGQPQVGLRLHDRLIGEREVVANPHVLEVADTLGHIERRVGKIALGP